MAVQRIVVLAFCVAISGCGVAQHESAAAESARTVAAFEVPLPSEADRSELLSVLRAVAAPEGMHVDADTSDELEARARSIPIAKMTIHSAVWRGSNDEEVIATVMDWYDHLGQVWITFSRGKDPTLTSRFRESAMREILRRWPGTLSLPIMPTGAIPLYGDLVRTPHGYVVNPAEAHKYQLVDTERQPH